MSALTFKMYLTPFRFSGSDDVTWMLSESNYKCSEHGALQASVERIVTVDEPPAFNVTAAEVAALQAQKAQALEDYQRTVSQINERLSKLQAITNEVEA